MQRDVLVETDADSDTNDTSGSDAIASRQSFARFMFVRASGTLVLQGFSLLVGFATAVLLANLLGSAGYGRYIYALAWAGLLTTPAILGLDRFLVRSMAVYEVESRWGLMKGLLRRTNALVLAVSVTIVAVGWTVSIIFMSTTLRFTFCVAMLLIPLTALTMLRQGAMQAIGRVVSGQLPEFLIRPVLVIAFIGVFILVGNGALTSETAMGANVTAVAIAFVVGAVMLRRALPAALRLVPAQYNTRAWLSASLPMMWFAVVWYGNLYVSTLVVGTVGGPREAGIFGAVQKGAELVALVLVAANMSFAPIIARMYARHDREGLQHAAEHVARLTSLVSIPVAAAFALFPSVFLSVFGSGFQTGATALTILAAAQAVNTVAGPGGNVLIMTKYERAAVGGVAVGLAANVLLGVLLVPIMGVTGGAIASGSSLVLWNVVLVWNTRKRLHVNATALRWLAINDRD